MLRLLIFPCLLGTLLVTLGAKEELEFTEDWVTYFEETWEKHLKKFKDKPNLKYLEIGVYEGRSAFWMLDNILTGKSSKAVLVDPFLDKQIKDRFYRNVKIGGYRNKIEVIEELSIKALPKMEPNQFDLIYIDGDHHAKAVFMDLAYSWPLLKEGGILILDDYGLKVSQRPPSMRPQIPVDAFLTAVEYESKIHHFAYQVVIEKLKVPYWHSNMTSFGGCKFNWVQEALFNSNGKIENLSKADIDAIKKVTLKMGRVRRGQDRSAVNKLAKKLCKP